LVPEPFPPSIIIVYLDLRRHGNGGYQLLGISAEQLQKTVMSAVQRMAIPADL
jgi:hypothetical protein